MCMKRIAILTRDCAGINTAIRAVVRTAYHYGIDVLGVVKGYEGLINGDFIPLVEYLKNHGQYVELIAFSESASSQLIQQADEFVDLSKNKRKYLLAGQFRSAPRKRTSR